MSKSSLVRCFVTGGMVPFVLAGLMLVAVPAPAHAQGVATGRFVDEAVVRVTNIADRAKFKNYGYIDGVSILGGWVNQKSSLTFTMSLTAGVEYLFLAAGDNDALDVDLDILDSRGVVLASDVTNIADAIVTFTPAVTGRYTLRMTLFQSRNNVACVCVATILKKNGWTVPVKNLDKATGKIMKALADGDQAAQRVGNFRLDLRKAPNQWAFFGGVLRQGQSLGVNNMNMGFGGRVFVGAGDDFASIINLDLENNNNQAIKQDFKRLPVSVLDHTVNGGTHGLRVHNIQSNGPAVVLMAIMDIR